MKRSRQTITQRRALARVAEHQLAQKIAHRDRLIEAKKYVPVKLSAAIAALRTQALAAGPAAR